jgi:hypothetical protein
MVKDQKDNLYLAYHMTGRQGTVVTIEIPADKIQFVTYVYFGMSYS